MSFEDSFQRPGGERLPHSPVETVLQTRESESSDRLKGGGNKSEFHQLKDDGKIIFKPHSGEDPKLRDYGEFYKRERASYLVDRVLDLDIIPPTVIRELDGEVGSAQEFVEDPVVVGDLFGEDEDDRTFRDTEFQEQAIRLWIFDYLIWNSDRHWGNALVKNNKLYAIDNGCSFGICDPVYLDTYYDTDIPEALRLHFLERLHNEALLEISTELLRELLSEEEVEAFRYRWNNLKNMLSTSIRIFDREQLRYSEKYNAEGEDEPEESDWRWIG